MHGERHIPLHCIHVLLMSEAVSEKLQVPYKYVLRLLKCVCMFIENTLSALSLNV